MLTRVQIKNFRCLRDVDVPLKPLTVLIGPNNTGKSSFLSAIRLLGEATERAQLQIQETDLWNFDFNQHDASVIGSTTTGTTIRVERGPQQQSQNARRHWMREGGNSDVIPISMYNSSILMPSMNSDGIAEELGIPAIDDKASNLPAYLDSLLRKDRDRFFRILDTLKRLIPGLQNINIETPSAKSRRIDLVLENGIVMQAKHASYGVCLMIFFVALANHPSPPKTILLEEPETGVHPRRLEDIMRLLRGLTEGLYSSQSTQVLISTHSPYLLDYVDLDRDQVLVFERSEDGSRNARPIDPKRLEMFLHEFMLGEIWLNQEEAGLVEKS
jgi:predicted ATPase